MAKRHNNPSNNKVVVDDAKPTGKTFKSKRFESKYGDDEQSSGIFKPNSPNSITDLVSLLESNKDIEIDATVYHFNPKTKVAEPVKMSKTKFIEAFKKNSNTTTFRESIDSFSTDMSSGSGVGSDSIPLLGGPFNRQLYLNDMLKMHQQAFYASTHDPFVKQTIDIILNFVLGRGFRADCTNKKKLALWSAFSEANNIQEFARYFLRGKIVFGEQFIHWLPENQIHNQWQLSPEQMGEKGLIPRVQLLDPSTVWEIVTYPEDVNRQLYLQLVYPTQYQIYTGVDKGQSVPSTKYIYRQIPVGQYKHYKANVQYNEKRGRSDLFSILGYTKRLRDSVNYSIIALQKATAFCIDTTIDGNQQDIDNYITSQEELGEMPPAGSEFVHSKKVLRTYQSNEGSSKGGNSQAFEWCFSMACMGAGVPMQYYGVHLSGGGTRGNAIVGTEPAAKKFELEQQFVETMLRDLSKDLFKKFGLDKEDGEIEFTFPEIIAQDRSAKLKDLAQAEQMDWISHDRAMGIAAKELNITDFDPELEKKEIEFDKSEGMQNDLQSMAATNPLTAPAANPSPNSSITSQDKAKLRTSKGMA